MAPRTSKTASEQIDDIEAQIAKLQQKKRQVLKKQSERVAKLVMESGLAELDINEAELAKALNDLAARFESRPLHKLTLQLRRIEGQFRTFENRIRRTRLLDRKKDAREKIQLGGLIVKAGLRETDKAILLGILMDASNRLGDINERDRWRAIGKAAFKNDTQKGAAVPDPIALMLIALWGLTGIETWLASFATTQKAYLLLGRIGLTFPFLVSAGLGLIVLFSVRGSLDIKWAGFGVLGGGLMVFAIAALREALRLNAFSEQIQPGSVLQYVDLYSIGGAIGALFVGLFGLKVGLKGNSAFGDNRPKRVSGRRSIHGESDWMDNQTAAKLFPEDGGIVIGERYRVDQDSVSEINFDPRHPETWGKGGKAPLVAFDQGFGSTHGIVFAGSGGYKTTSVVIPTCLQYPGSMIVLDPSTEIAPMVAGSRNAMGQKVICLDPKNRQVGFNVLDWIGKFGSSMEEDMATVAAWIMSEKPRIASGADDFFRTNAEQLITSVIAHVVFSDLDNSSGKRSLRTVRSILTKPEENLKEFLAEIHDTAPNEFVKELVGPFINMTPQTFSGVYATAAKETHWLSYETYAALVSGKAFKTDIIANGRTTIFLNIDLSTLENHPGMARVIIGAFLKAVYNRDGDIKGRVLFLLDEAARLGYMRIIETARDAGRKYGISLLMLFQSLGQMREAFGGKDATSKWFESASWVSFAAINDPDTARYISERCGMTTIEVEQVSRSSRGGQVSRNRSRQLSQRPLIQPHEVLQMRSDEQIVFTSGNEPLRCGRAMFFRRKEMTGKVEKSRFGTSRQ